MDRPLLAAAGLGSFATRCDGTIPPEVAWRGWRSDNILAWIRPERTVPGASGRRMEFARQTVEAAAPCRFATLLAGVHHHGLGGKQPSRSCASSIIVLGRLTHHRSSALGSAAKSQRATKTNDWFIAATRLPSSARGRIRILMATYGRAGFPRGRVLQPDQQLSKATGTQEADHQNAPGNDTGNRIGASDRPLCGFRAQRLR